MGIGERLRAERERLDMSQEQCGALGGVRKQAQLMYEKGERNPDSLYLAGIAAHGADVLYILTGERSAAALSADEQELLALFRAAPLAVKAAVIGALQGGVLQGGGARTQQQFHGPVHGGVAGGDLYVNQPSARKGR